MATTYARDRAIFTRLVNCCWSLFQWCLLLVVVAAFGIGGYLYFRLDDEIRRQVEQRLTQHYDNLQVRVGAARFEQDRGIAVSEITLHDPASANPNPMLVVGEMYLAGKLRVEDLVSDRLCIDEIVLRRAQLRAVRASDGSWNVKTLLPLPDLSQDAPVLTIQDTMLTLEDAAQPDAPPHTIPGINLQLTPVDTPAASPGERHYRITGTAAGLPARESRLEGDLCTSTGEMNVTLSVAGLELSSELLATLPQSVTKQMAGADVAGRADVTLKLERADFAHAPTWSATATIDRGRLSHPRLPAPLTDLVFRCHANGDRLFVEHLVANCGTGRVALAVERTGWQPNAPLAVAAKITGIPLSDELRDLLPPGAARAWQRFEPRGIVDAEIRLQFDGQQWRPQFAADCRNVSLTDAEKFPYRVEQTSGRVEYRPADAGHPDVLVLNLTGVGGGRPVRIEAEMSHLARNGQPSTKTGPIGWLQVSGEDIPLHEQLIVALPQSAQALVRSLRAQGAVDFVFRADWKTASQVKAEVMQDIRLKNCTISHEQFPFTLRQVNGLVTERNDVWTIHDVTARGASDLTSVTCRGTSIPRGEQLRTDLTIEAKNVGLDDNLKVALSPAAQQAWDELHPQGRINFTAHVVHDTELPEPLVEARLEPCEQSVSIEPAKFPYRLDQIAGVAICKQHRVELHNVSARHDRATFSAVSGVWQAAPDGGWQLNFAGVSADRLAPSDLLVVLPPDMRHTMDRLQPSGSFTVYNSGLSLAKAPRHARVAAAWDVNLVCHQASLRGSPLQSMTGEIRLVGRDDGQTITSAGELSLDSLVWKDAQLTNVRGPLWFEPTTCLFGDPATRKQGQPPRRITADAYGGFLTANVELKHDATQSYNVDLAVGGVSLARFANERLGGPKDMNGTVSGRLVVSGAQPSYQSLRGLGELHVVDANIYELPVLVAMLKVLRNRTPNSTAFNRCDAQFTIEGERIEFEKLNLIGDAVSLYGKGESGLDRQVDLTFYTLIEPANLPIPLWKTIAGQVSKQTLQLNVDGTWDKVNVEPQTLPAVNHVWEQLQEGAATMAPAIATREPAGTAQ